MAGQEEAIFQPQSGNLFLENLVQAALAEQDETDVGIYPAAISAAAATRTPNPFSGLSRPAAPTMYFGRSGNIPSSRSR